MQNWKKTLLLYPQYDFGIHHPTDSKISQILDSESQEKNKKTLEKLSGQYGLLFFYNGRNPLSKMMLKTVAQFSIRYRFSALGVSVDHHILQSKIPSKINRGQASALGVRALPALVLVNLKTKYHVLIQYGYSSQEGLLTDVASALRRDSET